VVEADHARREFDAVAVVLAVLLAFAATVIGVRTGWHPADADEIVYRDTLVLMRHGVGVYQAQRQALIIKERRPPTSVRAIRPPTMYLVLRWFPPSSWRWLVGLVYLADLLLVWRLARAHGPPGGVLAVALAGIWVLGFTSFLFLHAEVWGLPFFLAGLLALRPGAARPPRPYVAVAFFLVAAIVRELYAVGLLAGLVLAIAGPPTGRRSSPESATRGQLRERVPRWRPPPDATARARPWVVGLLAGAALYLLHVVLALGVLSAHGYNARFGNEHRTLAFLLRLVAPISSGAGELFGAAVVVLGVAGAARVARRDPAAVLAAGSAVVLLIASVWATRVYWSACWALPLAAFAPAALPLGGVRPRTPAPTG
jgi:hypothetical protein